MTSVCVCVCVCRCRFLLECLHDMDKRLRTYNSRLYVIKGQPIAVLDELFHIWNVQQLTFQKDMEPNSKGLEDTIANLAESCGVKVCCLGNPYYVLSCIICVGIQLFITYIV